MALVRLCVMLACLLSTTGLSVQAESTSSAMLTGSVISDVKSPLMLYGRAETSDAPDLEMFQDLVMREPGLSCQTRSSMDRLFRVAHDEQMRKTVWKRMQRQELLWVSNKVLSQIERAADLCNMRLVP